MSGRGAVVPVHTTAIFRLDVDRVREILRGRGYDCEVRRSGTVVVAEASSDPPGGLFPLLKNLERAIEQQLKEAGLVRRDPE